VAFLTTSLMEDVLNRGTGAAVRALGFTAPAAGKTGTSRDGWFAGYTSNLLCVVWIGFDDNRDLGLSGTAAAAPLWGEFMKRAVMLPNYKNTQDFAPPEGVIQEAIDPQTGQVATAQCPQTEEEYFVAGSQPQLICELHSGNHVAQSPPVSWLAHLFGKPANLPPPPAPNSGAAVSNANRTAPGTAADPEAKEPEKKKGLLDKIFGGIFGGGKKPADDKQKPPQ
jgi:penicillin-binding protein 1B